MNSKDADRADIRPASKKKQKEEEKMNQELTQSELDEIAEFQQYKYDTQLLLEGEDLDDLEIRDDTSGIMQ